MTSFDHKWVSTIPLHSMGFNPIPLDDSRTTFLGNSFVRGSVKFFLVLAYSKEITSCFSNYIYRTMSNTDMSLFFIIDTVVRNSDCCLWITSKEICVDCSPHNGMSVRRPLRDSASWPANSRTIDSDSMVEQAIHVCFAYFREITPLPNVKT